MFEKTYDGHPLEPQRFVLRTIIHAQWHGFQNKPKHVLPEYVCMENVGDKGFVNANPLYEPLEVETYLKTMLRTTMVHVTAGVR